MEPRRFHGTLLQGLPAPRSALGEIYAELYLTTPSRGAGVGPYKNGTRVVPSVARIEAFDHPPWNSGYVEGILDAAFLQLTPGTRDGIVYDAAFNDLVFSVQRLEAMVIERVDEQRRAEEEEASKSMLRRITRALREAFAMLPDQEYGWLAARAFGRSAARTHPNEESIGSADATAGAGSTAAGDPLGAGHAAVPGSSTAGEVAEGVPVREPSDERPAQRQFFEIPGPLHRVDTRPAKATIPTGGEQTLRAIPRDRSRRQIDYGVTFRWEIARGSGSLDTTDGEMVVFHAPDEPELATVHVAASQNDVFVNAEALITSTAELVNEASEGVRRGTRGLPGYTFSYRPGELWRSHYSAADALITVNSGHPDFVHAARTQTSKLRYVARLFAKEIVLANFPGESAEQLLERMIELSLYMDEQLR